jgi:hypothetical protein
MAPISLGTLTASEKIRMCQIPFSTDYVVTEHVPSLHDVASFIVDLQFFDYFFKYMEVDRFSSKLIAEHRDAFASIPLGCSFANGEDRDNGVPSDR